MRFAANRKQRIDDLAMLARPLAASPEGGAPGGGAPGGGRAVDRTSSVAAAVKDVSEVQVADAGHLNDAVGVSLLASAWQRLRRNPIFLVGAAIIGLFLLLAMISPFIAPHDPAARLLIDQMRPQTQPDPRPAGRLPARAPTPRAATCSPASSSAAARRSSSASSPRSAG